MFKRVDSKLFSQTIRDLEHVSFQDVYKAINRILVDPTLNQYKRPYLGHHLQEHPTDKTKTVFFEIVGGNIVFFVWINYENHPHNTHKNFGEDPCIKEFDRLKNAGTLEVYSQNYHEGVFTVTPRPNKPAFISFKKFDATVFSAIYYDGETYYTMAITTHESEDEIFDHYKIFLEKLREHFLNQKMPFEIRVNTGDKDFEILLEQNIDQTKWKKQSSAGDITWSI